ncbi:MAG: 3-phosphoshikimate 1-carboxyvinyltransferase [Clostridiales bacterium]|jgi:3-phosphoshikimate 1-carboxyvinyltransferase|nr:3-phosphoshikimate 1-carboxyvinyltransferase [Clostridiales bacterium]
MNAIVKPGFVSGATEVITSKSFAHRALICAALASLNGGESVLRGVNDSDDVNATIGVLTALGFVLERTGGTVAVKAADKESLKQNAVADCRESGSTLRFMLPVTAALGINAKIIGTEKLLSRPTEDLLRAINAHGVSVEKGGKGISLSGKLSGGTFEIKGDVSSQFITGLLLASPLTGGAEIRITGELVSADYILLTGQVMSHFGVAVEAENNVFTVRNGCGYRSAALSVEADWSNAAFPLVAGAIAGTDKGVVVLNTSDSAQGDIRIKDILRSAGAVVETEGSFSEYRRATVVKPSRLKAFVTDAENIPDMIPVLAVLAANAEGTSKITGVNRLREKESDRLAAITENLTAMGGRVRYDGEVKGGALYIEGGVKLKGAVLNSHNDHRMVMSAAVAALAAEGETTIIGAEAVNKSYPGFFDMMKALGADITIENP